MTTIQTQPSATPVIQALRSIGYNAQTAIADLIDNSIDAKANEIRVDFSREERGSSITIFDNGIGMSEDELQQAMTIGSKDPREKRARDELGRFGMGLKTASFSLGKRLSVITKKNGVIAERCWDLDFVSEQNEWLLFKEIPNEVRALINEIEGDNGTIVYIDRLDRFCGEGTAKPLKTNSYNQKLRRIEDYLRMVFHQLISDTVKLFLNDNELQPWDPFLSTNLGCIEGEEQTIKIGGKTVYITPYVLPHPSTFNEREYRAAGGIKGWRDSQGFYVYRGKRLVNQGDWFGMFPKEATTELARIKLEFCNEADDDWKIDVKKSSISVPDELKEQLKSIAQLYREQSREMMLYRTKSAKRGERIKGSLNTWELYDEGDEQTYKLNRTHPILIDILKSIADEQLKKRLNIYLKLIEMGSPHNLLRTDQLVQKDEQQIDESSKHLILEYAMILRQTDMVFDVNQLAETILLLPGFSGISIGLIKQVIYEGVAISD